LAGVVVFPFFSQGEAVENVGLGSDEARFLGGEGSCSFFPLETVDRWLFDVYLSLPTGAELELLSAWRHKGVSTL
jgi:hypothetical protein